MSTRRWWRRAGLVAVACGVFASGAARAQEISRFIRVRKVEAVRVRTPEYRIAGGAAQKPAREWLELRAEYDTAPEWIDELAVQFFVLMRTAEAKPRPVLLKGEATYVNIPKGNRHVCVAYLHPNTLARYGEVERVAVGLTYRGQTLWESQPATAARWWEELTPVTGFVLNRMETPFAMLDFDNYEAMKAAAPR